MQVVKLKAILREQASKTQVSAGYTEVSGEETVESTSEAALRGSNNKHHHHQQHQQQQQNGAEANCSFTVEDYSTVSLPYWSALVPYYP